MEDLEESIDPRLIEILEEARPLLSEDQLEALRRLLEALLEGQKVLLLTGAAGTGKTFLMRFFSRAATQLGFRLGYMAPTGKAAARLSESVESEVKTIHTALYRRVHSTVDGKPVFSEPGQLCRPGTIVVCDEASMVPMSIHKDILKGIPDGSCVLYVGDQAQVDPVVGTWGPNFDTPTAVLTEVHRQALESDTLRVATDVRNGGKMPTEDVGEGYLYREGTIADVAEWVADNLSSKRSAVALTYMNDTRRRINLLTRRELGFIGEDLIMPGEQMVVLLNNNSVRRFNGETLIVDRVEPFGRSSILKVWTTSGPIFVHSESIGMSVPEFKLLQKDLGDPEFAKSLVLVDYGYGLTVHKAQGSEFDSVMFVLDGKTKWMMRVGRLSVDQARRLSYTAITRAKETFIRMDVR